VARAWASTHGLSGKVTCSSGFKSPAGLSSRADFICLVRHSSLDCAVLQVSEPVRVRLLHEHADCAQPL
jgi:hypothetical protein